jgi:hypothetical protein
MLVRPLAVGRRRGLGMIGAATVVGVTPRARRPLERGVGAAACRVGGTCPGLEELARRRRNSTGAGPGSRRSTARGAP